MSRVMFAVEPHSVVDVITNSSSELFVGEANTKEALVKMIEAVYPEYLGEYHELKSSSELDVEDIETYLSYACERWSNQHQRMMYFGLPGIAVYQLFKKADPYPDGRQPDWMYLDYEFVQDNIDLVRKGIDPKGNKFFLFSRDQNPNWDMQERLMEIMDRYHLG